MGQFAFGGKAKRPGCRRQHSGCIDEALMIDHHQPECVESGVREALTRISISQVRRTGHPQRRVTACAPPTIASNKAGGPNPRL